MSEQKEEIIEKRDPYYGSPNTNCPACVNAVKDIDYSYYHYN